MAHTIIREDFDNFAAWARCAGDDSRRQYKRLNASRQAGNVEFRGTASLQEAVDLALYGWPAGREAMVDAIAAVRPVRDSIAIQRHDVAGAYPDVCRAIAGDPMSMVAVSQHQRAPRPVVRIDYDRVVAHTVESQAIVNRGAALLTVVDQLEAQGYSVELRLIFKRCGDEYAYHESVAFKAAGEPLDIDRAAFALVNPSVLRRLDCAMTEQHREFEGDMGRHYGIVEGGALDSADDAIFVSGANNSDLDPAAAWARLAAVFANYLDAGDAA